MNIAYGKELIEGLPYCVIADGNTYGINTDFKVIIDILHRLENGFDLEKCAGMFFTDNVPSCPEKHMTDFIGGDYIPSPCSAFSFYNDAGLIAGAFAECYGINIFETDMHWHVFTALFMSLGGDCAFSRIIRCRCGGFSDGKTRLKARRIAEKYN